MELENWFHVRAITTRMRFKRWSATNGWSAGHCLSFFISQHNTIAFCTARSLLIIKRCKQSSILAASAHFTIAFSALFRFSGDVLRLRLDSARVAKLADAPDLGSGGEILRGSSPLPGSSTNNQPGCYSREQIANA